MQEYGVVLRTNGKLADVSIRQQSACAKCGKCQLAHESKDLTISAVNQAGATAGQVVCLEMGHRDVVTAGLLVYGLPLLMLFLGVIIGQIWFGELGAAMTGFLALGITYGLIRWRLEPRLQANQRYSIVITHVINEREVN